MVSGSKKSRTFRRTYTRLPSSISKLNYKRRNPSKAKCGDCGKPLHGVLSLIVTRLKNKPKSHKIPTRRFAGNLCSSCARTKLKDSIRK